MDRLAKKVCLITGGGGAIGRAIAKAFKDEGAVVIISDINEHLLNASADALGCESIVQDVTSESQWECIVGDIEKKYGRIDVLVNNAGILGSTDNVNPETTQVEDFRRLQLVNVESVMLGCRTVIPAMKRAKGGSIINISSIAAAIATPFEVSYGLSKAAVRHLSWSVGAHCAPFGIRCNSIMPGQIETGDGGMMDSIFKGAARRGEQADADTARTTFTALIPLGTLGTPYDIAMGAVYLASDESRYVSSISLQISGGWSVL
ncbi:SDR family oxidoreductase [Paraburkholderia phenoliruptrix]|uniref:3-alpha-(Or 20-beta)-hydroxysteroid dehydrogenase n=2 Tax=Paraburkholderia phenoliruptrix TaxID=252970 RepID=K0DW17_9BURK|nr:SDR family oxidoreductase [Paraburkholderia phenoliruptrix]AFT90331.1 3-alpha-(or 20-beta)-hydroxysteroid dehydrogenase [Paraburkholderia phenoliruptrix BR3459a]CAB4051750.1 2,5-dichloro-2,5-cyclohexadiene-1,4-diol dehydrogenase LinX [Paraburkholderia phenoliruptrix]